MALLALWGGLPAYGLEPAEVLILVNRDVSISSDVGKMYRHARLIPPENVLQLHLGASRIITRDQYRTQIAAPLKKYLEDHAGIRCVLTTAGVPYVIQTTPGTEDGAAVDNELAAVLRDEPKDLNRWQPNPLYSADANIFGVVDPRALRMVYVARLDGPDLKIITRMVEDGLAAEVVGLNGPAFGDSQGLDGNSGAAAVDASIRAAVDRLSGAGLPSVVDLNPADWRPPAGGVGEQAAGAAFYVGWYSLQKFQDIFGQAGLARGAIAWHIASGEAVDIWSGSSTEWCVNLMRRGAAVTLGPVFEPYGGAFPKAEILVESLLSGRTIAESYWLALPHTSWAMVLLGDPLYRPFGVKPRPALVARAYVGAAASRVVGKGQTGPILVQVQCVGPAKSKTAAFTASVEMESGLAQASGMVTIPSLEAGQFTVVRVPSITAAGDPTGMFRLRLHVQNPGETDRRIVLEGRAGFSKIAGFMGRQNQMFVSPRGQFVISGLAGNTLLTETATLQIRRVAVPEGWSLAGAAFSPDESHVVLVMVDREKHTAFVLAGSGMQQPRPLPQGSQFIRWLSVSTILLKTASGVSRYDIVPGTTLPVFEPPGWNVNTVIPGTSIQLLTGAGGRTAIRNGAAALQEVLAGVKVEQGLAVANDLSLFGGMDAQKRLWIQHGAIAPPEIAAEGVERILWGPISRRALIETSDGKFGIYDGRGRAWISLPPMLAARWSPDEERLLYLEAERRNTGLAASYVSLLDGNRTERLCDSYRIGELGGWVFVEDGEAAFLLAGPEGRSQVWMMALPPRVQPKQKP